MNSSVASRRLRPLGFFFFFNDTATTEISTLSLPDALPIFGRRDLMTDLPGVLAWHAETTAAFDLTVLDAGHFMLEDNDFVAAARSRLRRLAPAGVDTGRSEEHTSELQSPCNLVCRLLLGKK